MRLFALATVFLTALHVAAQSLPGCAQICVGKTKTKCTSTDYACACSNGYLPKLAKCVAKACSADERSQAQVFLSSLCAAVGHPIDEVWDQYAVLELRRQINQIRRVEERQFEESFRPGPTDLPSTTSSGTATGSTTIPTSNTDPGHNKFNGGGSRKKSSFGTAAKIGVGVAIPLGLGLLAILYRLLLQWKKKKSTPEPNVGAPDQNAGGVVPPYQPPPPQYPQQGTPHPQYPQPTNPTMAEMDGKAQYIGHEMATSSNVAEMGGSVPPSRWGQQSSPQQQPTPTQTPSSAPVYQPQQQQHPTPVQTPSPTPYYQPQSQSSPVPGPYQVPAQNQIASPPMPGPYYEQQPVPGPYHT
ncbi:hypothetical protein P154DRAFT_130572 [Amniculicola lignicola CBS 123094]|uniref:CFEM domain-containing protein n=1 Tax=Amniculicola lignicola CBS 123094 TaxID=1392246 RepID=A0A6A5WKZ1_9PLEO|nr:hypothetical protein P154DRAFT_130572 [Amniculicola lignicola CBS 123094]